MEIIKSYEDFEKCVEKRLMPKECKGCWVWKSNMNYSRCKTCCRNYGDMYIPVVKD